MDTPSTTEVDFAIKSIGNQIRLDTREFEEKRRQVFTELDIPQADRSINVRRRLSEIELNISFKTSKETLKHMNLVDISDGRKFIDGFFHHSNGVEVFLSPQTLNLDDFKTLQTGLCHPNPVFKQLEEFLEKFKIGVLIEVIVIRNDGNILDMIFDGIKYVFSDISIPNISDLSNEIRSGIDLPSCISFAVLGDSLIADPTFLEESSASGIVHVFKERNQAISIFAENSINFEVMKRILANIPLPS